MVNMLSVTVLTFAEQPTEPAQPQGGAGTYEFASWLHAQGDAYRAITEFKRYEFESLGKPTEAARGAFAAAACYQLAQEWERALRAYQYYGAAYPGAERASESVYRLIECLFGLQKFVEVEQAAAEFGKGHSATEFADDAAFLSALSRLMRRDWAAAATAFQAMDTTHLDSPLLPAARRLHDASELLQAMPRKSPQKAVLLSGIFPGTGQAYAGRKKDGWAAFLFNAALGYLTYDRFDRHDNKAAIPLLLLTSSFYAGNVYGAGNAAVAENRRREETTVEQVMADLGKEIAETLGHPALLRP